MVFERILLVSFLFFLVFINVHWYEIFGIINAMYNEKSITRMREQIKFVSLNNWRLKRNKQCLQEI